MTEKEKMLAGQPYNAETPLLRQERLKARQLCFEYNNTPPEKGRAVQILDRLLGKHGKNCCINPNFFCDYGYNIEVGDNFFAIIT